LNITLPGINVNQGCLQRLYGKQEGVVNSNYSNIIIFAPAQISLAKGHPFLAYYNYQAGLLIGFSIFFKAGKGASHYIPPRRL
jgi:hypothetical protein